MTLIDLFAGVGYLIVDICALCSVLGSAIMFIFILAGRTNKQIPEQIWTWSGSGLILGILFLASLLWTNEYPPQTPLFNLSLPLVGLLLTLSLALLLAGASIRRTRRQRYVRLR
ncbi:MAG TPA: hypothetical protein P5121_35135 [Caldilineaceae bacterium]|nr:hypothetical protein [Caldilineaceae bacterium]